MKPSSSVHRPPLMAWLSVALLALMLGACGFQPRGQALATAGIPSPVFIAGISPYSGLSRELERQLKTGGAEIASSADASAAVLRVSDWDRDSRLLAVNSRNRAVEFELEETARFSLHARSGEQLVDEQTVRVTRIQYRPETVVLGSARENEVLREDMLRELAARIIRRLAAQY